MEVDSFLCQVGFGFDFRFGLGFWFDFDFGFRFLFDFWFGGHGFCHPLPPGPPGRKSAGLGTL